MTEIKEERKLGFLSWFFIVVLVLIIAFGVCISTLGESEEENAGGNQPCRGENSCQSRGGCAESQGDDCDDRDEKLVLVCVQPGSCNFGGEEEQPA